MPDTASSRPGEDDGGSRGAGRHVAAATSPAGAAMSELSKPWGGVPPAPLGSGPAFQAVGEVAAPLLAGFSITLVGVIAQSPGSFRWAGLGLLLLSFAAGLLLFAVQAGFHARQVYWTRDDLLAWFRGPLTQKSEEIFGSMHNSDRQRWETWKNRTRRCYNVGIIMLLLAMAVMLAPRTAGGPDLISAADDLFRWVAAAFAAMLAVAEIIWWRTTIKRSNDRDG